MTLGQEPAEADCPVPSYAGDNLVNLAAELELSLTGRSPSRGLSLELAELTSRRLHPPMQVLVSPSLKCHPDPNLRRPLLPGGSHCN